MRVVAVLDVLGGVVVRGVGGRREAYRPIESLLCNSCEPREVARAFQSKLGIDELYVADLDAIAGGPPNVALYDSLRADGFRLWVDAGARTAAQLRALAGLALHRVVAGLETLAGPEELVGGAVFSLDLRAGVPVVGRSGWADDPLGIVAQAVGRGVREVLVLDLARVGVGGGVGTDELSRSIRRHWPEVSLSVGGGVRGIDDLWRAAAGGVSAVLVASALHDGRLTLADLKFGPLRE